MDSGRRLTENWLGEPEEAVERAMKMQLRISIRKAQYIALTLSGNMRAYCPLYPEYNHKDAYILHDI